MKRLCAVLIAFLFVMQCFSVFAVAEEASGTPKHIPRVVSVVFDDSGSMYSDTDRWAYTSYAMQAFTAMMGSSDVLYVTYLNAASNSGKINLSNAAKQGMIDRIEETMFGGGTPNKLQDGADCLTKEYAKYGAEANYYLVVMADGELDDSAVMQSELERITENTVTALNGAEFQSIYFSMKQGDTTNPQGVSRKSASTSKEIVDELRDISAEIMGRTAVDFAVSNGKVTFDLAYPALNIAIFVQKENTSFSNVRVPLTKDGKSASYNVGTYYVDCPTKIDKNPNATKYTEVIPASPPSGFISLVDNGSGSLPKGSYTVDLSAYGVSKDDIVVLVEPAVKIGCQYYIGDSETPLSFSELKEQIRADDTLVVKCSLYEINEDGSLGDAVPLSVLSPQYSLYINGEAIGNKLKDEDNTYQLTIQKEFADQELKIEAVLKGYQPFVTKETFGAIKVKPEMDPNSNLSADHILLTKTMWKDWLDGKQEFSFPLTTSDSSVLSDLSIKTEGIDFLPSGNCSELTDYVRMKGSTLTYTATPNKEIAFRELPASFTISLCDDISGEVLTSVNVEVVQPQYKLEVQNELQDVSLGLETLKTNTQSIVYTLTADYDRSGTYTPVQEGGCESSIAFLHDAGALTGDAAQEFAVFRFTPQYDADVNTDVPASDILGKRHTVSVSAEVDGVTVAAEDVVLSVNTPSYKIVVENPITSAFTLDTIKDNQQKIVFSLLADYEADGNYGAVAAWDRAVYDMLTVDAGELPGKFATEYDIGGNPVGKSFTPLYDENNNNGVTFTKVAGKVHTIVGSIEEYEVRSETTVEVLAPKYDIVVRKENLSLLDTQLIGNEQGVEFVVLRNDRALDEEELESLAYTLSFSKGQGWMALEAQVTVVDGEARLLCKPVYSGWTFISPHLWNWMTVFMVSKGDMDIILTVGENVSSAAMHVGQDLISLIIFLIILGIILVVLWIVFCYLTRIRFQKGLFYLVSFRRCPTGVGYQVQSCVPRNPGKKSLIRFFKSGKFFIPFSEQSYSMAVSKERVTFVTKKSPVNAFITTSYPYAKVENNKHFSKGSVGTRLRGIILRDTDTVLQTIPRNPLGQHDVQMIRGRFLTETVPESTIKVVMFLSKKDEKAIRERARRRAERQTTTSKRSLPRQTVRKNNVKKHK